MTSPPPGNRRRQSSFASIRSLTRRISSFSGADQIRADVDARPEQLIAEEIAQIKRYEDFTTIDWVHDASRTQLRRKVRRQEHAGLTRKYGWRYRLWDSYEAGQAWIVVTLVGAAIGLNSAFLNIVTEWLSDIKLGYCTTAFYLNESFCCWGEESGCAEFKRWTSVGVVNYLVYILFAILFASTSARLVKSFAPYAAGSGISEIKCIIAGFVMKGFLGFWTLLIKSIGLPLSIASGLSVGKEGPSVHFAVCTGNVISRLFERYRKDAAKTREILSASAAAGVGVAFGSPIGGVLFSLEEMSNYFPIKTLWRSYFCALVATSVLAAMNPFRTGQLVMFQVKYDRSWHFFEILPYILIGIFGGVYGAFVIKWHLRVQSFRKKHLAQYPIIEATVLAAATAVICYPNMFLRIDMTEAMEILFLECEGGHDYNQLCEKSTRWRNTFSLAVATVIRTLLVILSYGCKVPAGIFVPSMAIGATFGRMVGIMMQSFHEAFPGSSFFASCTPDLPCITPGTYAFLGAGAALSGIMNLTISVVVIMFELTGALTYILPTMIVVGVTKIVSSRISSGGIADRMIYFNGYPFLDAKEDHSFGVPVSHVMTSSPLTILPVSGLDVTAVKSLLSDTKYQGFPIIDDPVTRTLLGYIGRTELRYALDRLHSNRAVAPNAKCFFTPHAPGTAAAAAADPTSSLTPFSPMLSRGAGRPSSSLDEERGGRPAVTFDAMASTAPTTSIDFAPFVDATPLTVHPRLPLETAAELFKKLGPRVVLVEHRGRLVGLLTAKDLLKYQVRVEIEEGHDAGGAAGETKVEKMLMWMKGWVPWLPWWGGGNAGLSSERVISLGERIDGSPERRDEVRTSLELEDR